MAVINNIRLTADIQQKLRTTIYESYERNISPDLNIVYNGNDALVEDILNFLVGRNINMDNDKLIDLLCIVFSLEM